MPACQVTLVHVGFPVKRTRHPEALRTVTGFSWLGVTSQPTVLAACRGGKQGTSVRAFGSIAAWQSP